MVENIPALHDVVDAFNSADFEPTVRSIIDTTELDNNLYRTEHGSELREISASDVLRGLIEGLHDDFNEAAHELLDELDDATVYAVAVVMYAGRDVDEALPHMRDRYDSNRIEHEFREWWKWLHMDEEHFAREMVKEKWCRDKYLRAGMHMFRIDER